MNKLNTIILLSALIFSACSSTGGSSSTQQDITGTGLKIDLKFDDQWISQKKLGYRLTIENTGAEEIKLSQTNFKLYTLQVDDTGLNYVFTENSLNNFYNTIFDGVDNKIYLPQNAKLQNANGQLIIDDWFFDNLNSKDFTYYLEINYPTKTTFSNNIEITKDNENPLKVTDKLSQAAPVQITKITMSAFEKEVTRMCADGYIENFLAGIDSELQNNLNLIYINDYKYVAEEYVYAYNVKLIKEHLPFSK